MFKLISALDFMLKCVYVMRLIYSWCKIAWPLVVRKPQMAIVFDCSSNSLWNFLSSWVRTLNKSFQNLDFNSTLDPLKLKLQLNVIPSRNSSCRDFAHPIFNLILFLQGKINNSLSNIYDFFNMEYSPFFKNYLAFIFFHSNTWTNFAFYFITCH